MSSDGKLICLFFYVDCYMCFMASEYSNSSKILDIYYDAFNALGYSKSLAEKRIRIYERFRMIQYLLFKHNNKILDVTLIVVGSRGEGCGIFSDVDVLFVRKYVKCFESNLTETRFKTVFQLDFHDVPVGYTKLKLVRIEDTNSGDKEYLRNIKAALVKNNDLSYLRNDEVLLNEVLDLSGGDYVQNGVFADVNGPARTFTVDAKYLKISLDFVQAFLCSCPSIVDSWCNRSRKNNWPSKDVIETIRGLDMLVVPVGKKDTPDEILQWRISHTLPEQSIVRSFNDPQIKLYVALKMLVKHELKPICENMTSYIVKNTTFWVFEKSSQACTRTHFLDIFQYALRHLRVSITWQYLPCYMLPANNLLENRVSERERKRLIHCLDAMLAEGCDVFLRCPLIKKMFEWPHNIFQEKLIYRELAEQTFLSIIVLPMAGSKQFLRFIDGMKPRNREQCIRKWVAVLFPYVRISNLFGFFNRAISMSDEEIVFRLIQGWKLGYNQE